MARTENDYKAVITSALPQGAAFPREETPGRDAVFGAIAKELAAEDALAERLVKESNPGTTSDLLAEWERDYGLPECKNHGAETVIERVAALVEKVFRVSSFNPKAIKAMCKALGYDVEFIERRPFRCGISHCGGAHTTTTDKARFWVTVKVKGPRVTRFTCGQSRCGEKLLTIRPATDLECKLKPITPSHNQLTYSYE